MPSRPRSPLESTFRWRAVQVVPSSWTSLTLPPCSRTNSRPSGANSITVGLLSPETTGASVKPGGKVVRVKRRSSTSTPGRQAEREATRHRPGRRDRTEVRSDHQEIERRSLLTTNPLEGDGRGVLLCDVCPPGLLVPTRVRTVSVDQWACSRGANRVPRTSHHCSPRFPR